MIARKEQARHVKGVVENILRKWEKGKVKRGSAVKAAWLEAVDSKAKQHTRPVSFKNGTLMAIVENSSWLYKMTLDKRKMLLEFNKHYTGRKKAKDIRFRVGTLTE
ncbi:MAG: DUF721 domain-containing protein [Candidatus Omnitrophota bacterium]